MLRATGDRCAAISLTQKQRASVKPWLQLASMLAITELYSQGESCRRSNPLGGSSRVVASYSDTTCTAKQGRVSKFKVRPY